LARKVLKTFGTEFSAKAENSQKKNRLSRFFLQGRLSERGQYSTVLYMISASDVPPIEILLMAFVDAFDTPKTIVPITGGGVVGFAMGEPFEVFEPSVLTPRDE